MAKILLVEDDPLILQMYSEKLKRDGYDVDVAENGEVGYEKLKSFIPDLVIMDIMMPRKSGLELITEMKKDLNFQNIPIVVLTNLTEGPDIEKIKEQGVNEYLVKSTLDPEDVTKTVQKYLK